jgi:uncharacterized surface protein with fasciclin (FAS1) repeats
VAATGRDTFAGYLMRKDHDMRNRLILLGALALVVAACGGADAADTTAAPAPETTAADTGDTTAEGDILDVAMERPELGTFLAALDSAGIMDGLHGEGPFTVFAPSNEAFTAYLGEMDMTQEEVFGDQAMLQTLLNNHVVSGMSDPAEMVMGMAGESFTSVSGLPLEVSVDGETVRINQATVVDYDIQGSNGVIHVIDQVLGGN